MKLKKFLSTLIMSVLLITGGELMGEAKNNSSDKVFPESDKVKVEKVHFTNRYGINLTGDLYTPKKTDKNKGTNSPKINSGNKSIPGLLSLTYHYIGQQTGTLCISVGPDRSFGNNRRQILIHTRLHLSFVHSFLS